MSTSGPDERTAPELAAATPPVERRFARRIDCAPRLNAAPPPAPNPAPEPTSPHRDARP